MSRGLFIYLFLYWSLYGWSFCTWTLALREGKALFLAKCSVTNLSDYRVDFLYVGALDSIQGARRIGFHSLFGHAGHFLFSFFPRKECNLLAYLLVRSVLKQETHSVPQMLSAEQNGFIDPKHSNCFSRARVWPFLERLAN